MKDWGITVDSRRQHLHCGQFDPYWHRDVGVGFWPPKPQKFEFWQYFAPYKQTSCTILMEFARYMATYSLGLTFKCCRYRLRGYVADTGIVRFSSLASHSTHYSLFRDRGPLSVMCSLHLVMDGQQYRVRQNKVAP